MRVTRWQVVARGLTNRCPNCGGRTLFQEGALFRMNPECPRCGLKFESGEEGAFLGAVSLNYGATVVCYLLPLLLLAWKGAIGATTAVIAALAGALLLPILLYRPARSWWLMNYYVFLPHLLPANRKERG